MSQSQPRIVLAGQREAGATCLACQREITHGEATAQCETCGSMHHLDCWQQHAGCQGYECRVPGTADQPVTAMKITNEELAAATPLPVATRLTGTEQSPQERRWNKTAVWAFGVSLLAIPAAGIITGPIAVVIGCIALAGHRATQRGMGLAAASIVLGIAAMIGWAVGLSVYLGDGGVRSVAMGDLTIDPQSLDELPEHIARAMRSNVLIESSFGLGRGSLGSGVVLKVVNGTAYIVTNRHVIDADYEDRSDARPNLGDLGPLHVTTVGQTTVPAKVEWVAPHGVDLSIISATIRNAQGEVSAAQWDADSPPHVGEDVFAIGNPQGLGWTHSGGSVSQMRRRAKHGYNVPIIQSTAAISAGSSGGGLYDKAGNLIGVNTLTADKRVAEGLGFAISLSALLDLVPERFTWLKSASQEPAPPQETASPEAEPVP